jgi:CRP/FNR family transcriptional regulator
VSGKPYQATADVLEPSQANFITRADFLGFLRENGEAALKVAQQLSEDYHLALSEVRTIGLSHSAAEKLARFLLEWSDKEDDASGRTCLKLTLTHEEIGQMIGASRETVIRLFADFNRKQILRVKGSVFVIRNRAGPENLAGKLSSAR